MVDNIARVTAEVANAACTGIDEPDVFNFAVAAKDLADVFFANIYRQIVDDNLDGVFIGRTSAIAIAVAGAAAVGRARSRTRG